MLGGSALRGDGWLLTIKAPVVDGWFERKKGAERLLESVEERKTYWWVVLGTNIGIWVVVSQGGGREPAISLTGGKCAPRPPVSDVQGDCSE